jgi:hypothetical protein
MGKWLHTFSIEYSIETDCTDETLVGAKEHVAHILETVIPALLSKDGSWGEDDGPQHVGWQFARGGDRDD